MEEDYKIVKIIDSETLVINAGSENGIRRGDKFEVYEIGQEVLDPDTKRSLGTLDTIKETVEAITVLPKMSICKHRYAYNPISNLSIGITRITDKTLNVETTEISGGLSEDTTIRVGDKARKIN